MWASDFRVRAAAQEELLSGLAIDRACRTGVGTKALGSGMRSLKLCCKSLPVTPVLLSRASGLFTGTYRQPAAIAEATITVATATEIVRLYDREVA